MKSLPSIVYRLPLKQQKSEVGSRESFSNGLTLIEVLIAMGLASMVGILLLVIMVNSAGIFSKQSSKVQTGLNSNDALIKIRESTKQANAVALNYTDGGTIYTSGPNQLVLKVSAIDSLGNIIADTFDYFVFYPDQNYLRFKVFADPVSSRMATDQILTNSLDLLVFNFFNSANPPLEVSPNEATKVRFSLVLKQKVGVNFETNTATSEANLRNN